MARRKRSYKIPPFRQLNPNYGMGPITPGLQGGNGLNNYNPNQMNFAQTGFESTMIRNETNMGGNNNVQTLGLIDPVQAQAAAPQMPIANPEVDSSVIDSSMEIATGKDMSQPIVDENPQNKLEQLYKLS